MVAVGVGIPFAAFKIAGGDGNCHGCIRSKFLPIDNNGKGFPKPRKDTVDVDADYGQIV
eukprot:gene33178-40256_t